MLDDLDTAIEALLAREIPGFVALQGCRQLTAGASQETWCIEFDTDSGDQRVALRRAQPSAAGNTGIGGVSLDTEARLFQLAHNNAIPGPNVLYVLREEDGLGPGFVMEWLYGETLGKRIVYADNFADIRPGLARQCGEVLGRIHAIDWQSARLGEALTTVNPQALIEETFSIYRDLNIPEPMIDYTRRWLLDKLPEAPRTTLVHGDFRNGNLMINTDGIEAVLDWELAHIGDPVRDLGWLCVNSWRFGNSALPVGGFGAIDDLLAGYRDSSGVEVSREQLRFWQVFGSFWWAITTLFMASTWRTGETPSLERPVIGRRSSEAQMDCVNLLIPGDFTLPDSGKPLAQGTQLPMPTELLEGVKVFLQDDIGDQLDTRNGFLAKVAANSLGIAQREFLCGGSLAEQERTRLKALLGQTGELDALRWRLVNRLREGMPLTTPGLEGHLRQSVAGQLAIDQPTYSALRG